jgi:hypothetical protein
MQISEEQIKTVENGNPLRISSSETHTELVLLRADQFDCLRQTLDQEEFEVETGYRAFCKTVGSEWDDPALDVYEQYRKKP